MQIVKSYYGKMITVPADHTDANSKVFTVLAQNFANDGGNQDGVYVIMLAGSPGYDRKITLPLVANAQSSLGWFVMRPIVVAGVDRPC